MQQDAGFTCNCLQLPDFSTSESSLIYPSKADLLRSLLCFFQLLLLQNSVLPPELLLLRQKQKQASLPVATRR